jgi:hypothetical protein
VATATTAAVGATSSPAVDVRLPRRLVLGFATTLGRDSGPPRLVFLSRSSSGRRLHLLHSRHTLPLRRRSTPPRVFLLEAGIRQG